MPATDTQPEADPPGAHEALLSWDLDAASLNALLAAAPIGLACWDRELRFVSVNGLFALIDGIPASGYLGRTLHEALPALAPTLEPLLRQVIETGVPLLNIEISDSPPQSGRHWLANYYPVRADDGRTLGAGAVLIEITRRKRAEEALQEKVGQQAMVAWLGQRALQEDDLTTLMDEAVAGVARTLGVEYCKVLELLPGGAALLLRAGVGWRAGLVGQASVSAGADSQAGYTLLLRQPVIVEDLRAETRFRGPPLLLEHQVVSGISVIIGRQDRPFGVLGAHTQRRRSFSNDDITFLQSVANVLAAAVERHTLFGRAQRQFRRLSAIHQAGQQLQQILLLEELAQEIIVILERMLGYDYGAVLLIDQESDRLIPFAVSDQQHGAAFVPLDKAYIMEHAPQLGRGITGWVAQTGQSVRLGDVRQDARYHALRDDIRSELCVPLRAGDEIIGVVNVETTRVNAYTEDDQWVLETVAAQIATTIENARLFEQVRTGREQLRELSRRLTRAQEEDRAYIARMLHEEVGQLLTGLKLELELSARGSLEEVQERLTHLQTKVNTLTAHVRDLALDLRPTMLDDLGVLPALVWHFQRYTAQTQVKVLFKHIGMEQRFPLDIEIGVYRIIQEALSNVARHARALEAHVQMWATATTLSLQVEDRGRGFDWNPASYGSGGLAWMRERALLLGGYLMVESAPGKGTCLTAVFSLSSAIDRRQQAR